MTTTAIAEAKPQRTSLVAKFAGRYGVDANKMVETLKATCFRQKSNNDPAVTNEQMMALLVIADQYGLNPFTKEIYAFPDKGSIVPVVGVDGWIRIINERPELQSVSFHYAADDSDDPWIECVIERRDRSQPIAVREYLSECQRDTGPWKSHPRRMLRHKALIQAARLAFGFSGIRDPDEAERIENAIDVTDYSQRGKPETRAPLAIDADEALPEYTEVPFAELRGALVRREVTEAQFCEAFSIERIEDLPLSAVLDAFAWIEG